METLQALQQAIPNQGFSLIEEEVNFEDLTAREVTRYFNIALWHMKHLPIEVSHEYDLDFDRSEPGNPYHFDKFDDCQSIIWMLQRAKYPTLTEPQIIQQMQEDYDLAFNVDRTIGL